MDLKKRLNAYKYEGGDALTRKQIGKNIINYIIRWNWKQCK